MKTREIIGRASLACAGVSFTTVVGYTLAVSLLLGVEESARDQVVGFSLVVGAGLVLASALAPLTWIPLVHRAIRAARASGEALGDDDRARLYGAPGEASRAVMLCAAGVSALGFVPMHTALSPGAREASASAGTAGLLMASLGVYPLVRLALRPLVASLPPAEGARLRRTESLAIRAALAVGIPSGVVALVAVLIVGALVAGVAMSEEEHTARTLSRVLGGPRVLGEGEDARRVMARVLAARGASVTEGVSAPQVEVRTVRVPSPGYGLALALLLGGLGGFFGLRIGQRAARQIDSSARRMELVELGQSPRAERVIDAEGSIPEVRQMAAALDRVADTLGAMAVDQRRAVTARSEAAKIRAFVLAGVSHDLRGPLNSVLGFSGLLLSGVEGELTDGQRESLEALSRGGRDLLRLVDDLLDEARLDAGRMVLSAAPRSLSEIVSSARRALAERVLSAQMDDVIVRIESPVEERVRVDLDRASGALGALLAFALMRPGRAGALTARVKLDEERGFSMLIHGAGTTPLRETVAQWFEPFDSAPVGQRVPAGLGLAVSVAKRVIELHGGSVRSEPASEGGLSVEVLLPG